MKFKSKIIGFLLTIVLILTFLSTPCYAQCARIDSTQSCSNDNTSSPMRIGFEEVCFDQYGYTGWGSLGAAMDCYGHDYTYTYCGSAYGDSAYNYYYSFSDGSKMFFGVHEVVPFN